jgi:hypothetical protein
MQFFKIKFTDYWIKICQNVKINACQRWRFENQKINNRNTKTKIIKSSSIRRFIQNINNRIKEPNYKEISKKKNIEWSKFNEEIIISKVWWRWKLRIFMSIKKTWWECFNYW